MILQMAAAKHLLALRDCRMLSPAMPARTGKFKLDTIQALRGIAACEVVFVHIPGIHISTIGVDIFFVISGFIISYVSERDRQHFFAKRLFRIVPLYWLGTLAVFAVSAIAPSMVVHTSPDTVQLFKSLFFIPYVKWGAVVEPLLFQGWTLNFEMFFYVIFAAALALAPKNTLAIAVAGLGAAMAIGALVKPHSVVLGVWTNPMIMEFVFGIGLYRIWTRWHDGLARIPLAAIALVCAALMAAMMFGFSEPKYDSGWWRVITQGVSAFCIVALMLGANGRIRIPWLLMVAGDASYSLYLFHSYLVKPFYKFFALVTQSSLINVLVSPLVVGVCLLCAHLLFITVERPSNLWLRRSFTPGKPPMMENQSASAP